MKSSTRLISNTLATYTRSFLNIGLILFSSRWVLQALGAVDFGLFSLVGSVLLFIAFLNLVMSSSASRYFAYAIGQGDFTAVNRWFNVTLGIHLILAITLTFVGWAVGDYVILQMLNIPIDRVVVCLQVFHISLFSLFTGMLSVPFIAMFTAKQQLAELAVWNTLQTILNFILAWFLSRAVGDRLLFYALGITSILVFVHVLQVVRAIVCFRECQFVFRQMFDKKRLKEIFSFAIWNLIGNMGVVLRDQGSAVLLNLYFGPMVNAAYGIAKQVSAQLGQFSAAMLGAFSPEITALEGRGDREGMIDLSLRASKFGTLLVLIFLVPLMTELEYVLQLWLVTPPLYTSTLCRLILCAFLVDRLSIGYMLAVNAHGRIAAYQGSIGTILVMTLPLAWLLLFLGYSPASVGWAFVATMTLCSVGRVFWAWRLLQVPVVIWVKGVLIPCSVVGILSSCAAFVPRFYGESNFLRLFLVAVCSFLVYLLATWVVALDNKERVFLMNGMKKIWKRLYSERY